jgi:hypothetical protein
MKFASTFPKREQGGYALILVLFITAVCLLILSATMNRTFANASLNDRNNQYTACLYAAESATEKTISLMKSDFMNGNLTAITNNLGVYRAAVPLVSESPYWGNFEFSDGQGHVGSNYIACTSSIGWGALRSQYGLFGWTNCYRIMSNVRQTGGTRLLNLTNAVIQDLELDLIPVFQNAIFYNGLLEFTWCATFTINGRVHANSNIFVGSAQNLTFNNLVTTTSGIYKTNWAGHFTNEYTGTVAYNNNPGYVTNVHSLTLPIGTNNTAAAVREIINPPPSGEDVNSPLGSQRYYNKAGLVFMVSDTNVVAILKNSASDPSPTSITANYSPTNYGNVITNFPFLSLTNQFTDQRENATIKASQIDVGVFQNWLLNNSSVNSKFPNTSGVYNNSNVVPNILYFADNRTVSSGQLTAIRVKNGTVIPTNATSTGLNTGFTIATPNPLYVWGNYNCPNVLHQSTTNTTATFPASLVSDAITLLSSAWLDSASGNSFGAGVRVAGPDTVNAAILAGIVFSTAPSYTEFSGGPLNLPRLLEDWSATTLTLNTSFVNLFDSARATNQWKMPGYYYYAPSQRRFSFDQNFQNPSKLPPGTPYLTLTLPAAN